MVLAGCDVTVATLFTASVPNPSGFALACQLDKGLPPETDYMAMRRDEDARALGELGVRTLHLGLAEAPHRGYRSADELFQPVRAEDEAREPAARTLARVPLIDRSLVLAPSAIGRHVDHVVTRDAVALVVDSPDKVVWYRDVPYASREAAPPHRDETAVGVGPALKSKITAATAYRSQLDFQFGGTAGVRRVLVGFALAEARRMGAAGPVETFTGTDQARRRLEALTVATVEASI